MLGLSNRDLVSRHSGLYPFVLVKEEAGELWDSIEPFIMSSVKHSRGMVTTEGIKRMLLNNDAVVIGTAIDHDPVAVTVCTVVNYSTYRACRIIAAAGKDLKSAMKFFHIIEGWAIYSGCSEVEAWCRPSVSRLLQRYRWRKTYEMVTIDLRRKLQ